MITKEKVIDNLKNMPDSFSIDELIDKLVFIERIEKGLEQSEKGDMYTTEQAKELLKKGPSKLVKTSHPRHLCR